MPKQFLDRYGPMALVTGASSGIGWGFAEELAQRGFDLVLTARRRDRLESLASLLEQRHGTRSIIVAADLAERAAPEAILSATKDLEIGLVVSNAGFGLKGPHASTDAEAMSDMLMVNCNAPMRLTRGFIPRLRTRERAAILMISSVEAMIGCPNSASYSATKAFVNALGEAIWAELHGEAIDVLTICPGATDTEAVAKQGIEASALDDLKSGREVARMSLDALGQGPVFYPSDHYRSMFDHLLTLPRRDALLAMAGQ